ncbi:MAG: glycoside hydrolase family 2 TIM barrel-domain containing protein [Cytophagaceae bacterium]
MSLKFLIFQTFIFALLMGACEEKHQPTKAMKGMGKVYIQKDGDKYTLYRNDQPYYIKGAAGYDQFHQVKACGGNSIRTWGGENTQAVLDTAWKHGLSVTVGLYIGPMRHGFDYSDKEAVRKQKQGILTLVKEFKDHPAVLMWGIGNELDIVNGSDRADNPDLWKAVNDIAAMIHEEDPNHPVTTMVVPFRKTIRNINKYCPEIDILSFNVFSGLHELKSKLQEPVWGWNKPYLISEWGPHGWWESERTLWDAPIEESSTKKAEFYKERYENHIFTDKEQCLGSYVFYWGQKQEITGTWFSMFDSKGNRSEAVHTMKYLWSGESSYNTPPSLEYISMDEKGAKENLFIESCSKHKAQALVSDKEGDPLTYKWSIKPESMTTGYWGENEKDVKPVFTKQGKNLQELTFEAPKKEGAYRLFCHIYDQQGNYATANFPFYVLEYKK